MSNPKAEVEVTAESRTLGAKLREIKAKFATFGGELKKNVFGKDLVEKGFFSKAGATMVGNLGSSAASAVGGFYADQATAAFQYGDALKRLQITAGKTNEEMAGVDAAVRQASDATGISRAQVLGAARQYVALTGDLDGATKSIDTWARVAQASESSISDVASTAQALRDNLKIKPEEMQAAFGTLIVQGKEGAVELKDLAGQLAQISPLMAQFGGGTGVAGLRDLGAATQVVRKGFGSAEETVTGMQSVMVALIKNAPKFAAAHVKVFDVDKNTGTKSLRGFREIIDAIGDSKLMKDPTKLEKAFGRVEAYRAFLQLNANKEMLDELVDKSRDASVINRDLGDYLSSTAGRTKLAWERAKNEIMDAVTPERIETFTSAAVHAAGGLAGMATALSAVLGVAESAGTGLAIMIGGKSAEDQVNDTRANRMREREELLAGQYDQAELARHPKTDLNDPDYIARRAQAVRTDLGNEQILQNQLNTQLQGGTITRKVANRTYGPDRPGQVHQSYLDAGNYSVPELTALKRIARGTSDEAMTEKLIDMAIQKLIAAQGNMFKRMLDGAGIHPITVKADGKAIVDVHRGSAAHAARPHG